MPSQGREALHCLVLAHGDGTVVVLHHDHEVEDADLGRLHQLREGGHHGGEGLLGGYLDDDVGDEVARDLVAARRRFSCIVHRIDTAPPSTRGR
jgi:hypothetical protein